MFSSIVISDLFLFVYRRLAQETRHVAPFVKLAYPDLVGASSPGESEPLGNCDRMVCR